MKKQSGSDKMDESLGMRRGKESSKSQSYKSRRDESKGMKGHGAKAKHHLDMAHKILSKMHEAKAGRKYNRSAKHRKAESMGMKKAMKRKYG